MRSHDPEKPGSMYIVSEFYRGYRLDRFIQAMIPKLSRAKIQAAIRSRVELSWQTRPRPALTVRPGGEVRILFPAIVEPEIGARPRILYEDDAILVADKPAGLLVHPTHSCLTNNLINLLKIERPGIPLGLAHRLDRDTSGVILLTKSVHAARALAGMFERREIEKSYLAVVQGVPARSSGRIDASLGVAQRLQVVFKRTSEGHGLQTAVTDFRLLEAFLDVSLLELSPRTGRRHQLRAHLAEIGHPIVGDKLYGLSDRDFLRYLRGRLGDDARRSLLCERQLLHAHRLRFAHPLTGEMVSFESAMPEDMRAFLQIRGMKTVRAGVRARSGAAGRR